MSAFDLVPSEAAAKMERRSSVDMNEGAGFFDGSLTAPATGAVKGLVLEPARVLNLGLSHIPGAIDQAFGTSSRDWWFENMMLERQSRRLTPNPREVGMAGQMLHSLFDVGGQAIATGPAGVAMLKTVGKSIEGVEEGLDPLTAMKKGAIEGASAAVGVALPIAITPFVGSKIPALVQQLGYGIATNVPMGIASRALTHDVLDKAGYGDMAEQYKALDETGLMTDFVLGAAFGTLGHAITSKGARLPLIRPADVDAALAKRNAYHIEVDTAPGVPQNGETRDAHVESVLKATEDLMAGRPVDVTETLRAADFEVNPGIDKARERLAGETEKVAAPLVEAARAAEPPAPQAFRPVGESETLLRSFFDQAGPKSPKTLHVALADTGEVLTWSTSRKKVEEAVEAKGLPAAKIEKVTAASLDQVLPKETAEPAPGAVKREQVAVAKPIEPERAAQIETALKGEGIDSTPENVQIVHLIEQARAADAAAVDALPGDMPDAEYLAKLKEIVDAKQKNEAAGAPGKGAAEKGPRAAGGEPRRDEGQGGEAARGQPGEAAGGGAEARAVEAAEIRGAEEVARANPDMLVAMEDGTTVPAHQALAKADEVIAQAEADAKGFEAAVLCATRRGG